MDLPAGDGTLPLFGNAAQPSSSRVVAAGSGCLPPAFPDVPVAFAVDCLGTFGEIAPDLGGGSEILQTAAEGFDGEPIVIAALADGGEGFLPGNVASPRHAAVVLRNMDVDDVPAVPCKGADRVGLFDIGVERVVHRPDIRPVDLVYMSAERVHRIEKVAFEPVKSLQADGDATLAGMIADGALAGQRALQFGGCRPRPGEQAER